MTTVINIFAGPGAGKSTTAAGLFYKMKRAGMLVELVTEYAKEKVWDNNIGDLSDQLYIYAKQNKRIRRLVGKVEYIITDSPLLLSVYYGELYGDHSDIVSPMMRQMFETYNNYNIYLTRTKPFCAVGRLGDVTAAVEADVGVRQLLDEKHLYTTFTDSDNVVDEIFNHLTNM